MADRPKRNPAKDFNWVIHHPYWRAYLAHLDTLGQTPYAKRSEAEQRDMRKRFAHGTHYGMPVDRLSLADSPSDPTPRAIPQSDRRVADRRTQDADDVTWDPPSGQVDSILLPIEQWNALNEEVFELRRWMWLNHGCPIRVLYGDDGEMQCNNAAAHPGCRILDFKRDDLISLVFAVRNGGERGRDAEIERLRGELDKWQCKHAAEEARNLGMRHLMWDALDALADALHEGAVRHQDAEGWAKAHYQRIVDITKLEAALAAERQRADTAEWARSDYALELGKEQTLRAIAERHIADLAAGHETDVALLHQCNLALEQAQASEEMTQLFKDAWQARTDDLLRRLAARLTPKEPING